MPSDSSEFTDADDEYNRFEGAIDAAIVLIRERLNLSDNTRASFAMLVWTILIHGIEGWPRKDDPLLRQLEDYWVNGGYISRLRRIRIPKIFQKHVIAKYVSLVEASLKEQEILRLMGK